MGRSKNAVLTPPNQKQAGDMLSEYADNDARIDETNAVLDQKITALRDEVAVELDELKSRNKDLMTGIQLFAETNRDKLFDKKKSLELQHGTIGFRLSTPSLKGIPRKGDKLNALIAYFRKFLPGYIRTQEELNKELIISDREKTELLAHLRTQGLTVQQSETFYIDLKKEDIK